MPTACVDQGKSGKQTKPELLLTTRDAGTPRPPTVCNGLGSIVTVGYSADHDWTTSFKGAAYAGQESTLPGPFFSAHSVGAGAADDAATDGLRFRFFGGFGFAGFFFLRRGFLVTGLPFSPFASRCCAKRSRLLAAYKARPSRRT
jgi:hypothetical protein